MKFTTKVLNIVNPSNIILRAQLKVALAENTLAYNDWVIATKMFQHESDRYTQARINKEEGSELYLTTYVLPDYERASQHQRDMHDKWSASIAKCTALEDALGIRPILRYEWPYNNKEGK